MITEAQKEKIRAMKEPIIYVHPDNWLSINTIVSGKYPVKKYPYIEKHKIVILDNTENPFRNAND